MMIRKLREGKNKQNMVYDNTDQDSDSESMEMIKETTESNSETKTDVNNIEYELSDSPENYESSEIDIIEDEPQIYKTISDNEHVLNILSSEHTDEEYYNDYCVNLSPSFRDVSRIDLTNFNLPVNGDNVNENNNRLLYSIGDKEREIELESGKYSLDELVEKINNSFKENSVYAEVSLKDGYIVITHLKDKKFRLIRNDNSILEFLGYNKNRYNGKSEYIAYNKIEIENSNKIYLFLKNIEDNPFTIDLDKNSGQICPITKTFKNPIPVLDNIIIKFHKTKKSDDRTLFNFNNKPHRLNLKICGNIEKSKNIYKNR